MALRLQGTGTRRDTLDQFYTSPEVAAKCIAEVVRTVDGALGRVWVEPSAGAGAFFLQFPPGCAKIGMDIDPPPGADAAIQPANFLVFAPPDGCIVVGNPPFGRQSSVAKAFIARACKSAAAIAFILPRSFVKPSMFGAFDRKFHLVLCEALPDGAFVLNGRPYHVPCVFQIWVKKAFDRPRPARSVPEHFEFVREGGEYDIAVRRVGSAAGRCHLPRDGPFNPQCFNFIKLAAGAPDAGEAARLINGVVFPSNTVGPRSLSKAEICDAINAVFKDSRAPFDIGHIAAPSVV